MRSALLLLLLFQFVFASAQLHGIDPNWLQSVLPIPTYNNGWNSNGAVANNMVVDKSGRVIIFYTEENSIQSKHYYTGSSDNGITWNSPSPTLFTPSEKTNVNSTLSADIDTNDIIHIIWSSRISKCVFYSSASTSDFIWSDTLRIGTTTKNNIGFCQISADRKGRIHAYWNEGSPGSSDTCEIYYTKRNVSSMNWTAPTMLSFNDGHHSAFPSGDFNGVDGDTLAIAWRDSTGPGTTSAQDWDIQMAVSTDGGQSWQAPFTITGGTGMQSDPGVVVDKNGIIHVAHHFYPQNGGILNSQVKYAYSDDLGITWTPTGFVQISAPNIQSHLVKEAYDYTNDIVWYFYKDQRDYISPFDKRADIMALSISNSGNSISSLEFLTDADSNEVGFHNFKIGQDGIPRAHFFIIPYGTSSTSLYYTQRNPLNTSNNNIQKDKYDIDVYPNPVNDRLYFSKECTEIFLYNMQGQFIRTFPGINSAISLTDIESGIYILHLGNIKKKIVVHH